MAFGTANAAVLEGQIYRLLDHPDGVLTASYGPYGLRADNITPPPGTGPTFSTELGGAYSTLQWNGSSAVITGTLFNNQSSTLWSVEQTLTGIITVAGGFQAAGGMLTLTDAVNGVFGDMDDVVYTFDAVPVGNVFTADDSAHRCAGHTECGPLVARGWIDPLIGDFELNSLTNDWLVQLAPVPLPAALPMFIAGLFALFGLRTHTARAHKI